MSTVDFAVTLFDGRSAVANPARARVEDGELVVDVGAESARYPVSRLRVSGIGSGKHRLVSLPDGRTLCCAELPWLSLLKPEAYHLRAVRWLEQRSSVAAACVLLLGAVVTFTLKVGVPWATDAVVLHVDFPAEAEIGRQALARLAEGQRSRTRIPLDERRGIEREFRKLTEGLAGGPRYRVHFLGNLPANAFAIPGGTLVVSDELVELCTRDELLAVLAHELGHAEHRHALRGALREGAAASWLGMLTGDLGAVSVAASRLIDTTVRTRYSREFEVEADSFAFALLRQRGHSPESFATCLEKITAPPAASDRWEFLSTHPGTASRAARARAESLRTNQ